MVFAGYIVLAARARRLFTTPKAIRILNRTTGAVMAGAAAAVACTLTGTALRPRFGSFWWIFRPFSRAHMRAGVKFQPFITK